MRPTILRLSAVVFGAVSLGFFPFWAVHFFRYGSVLDGNYVSNHYHYPIEELLDTAAGGIVWLASVVLFMFIGWAVQRIPRLHRLTVIILGTAIIAAANGWLGTAVLHRVILKFELMDSRTGAVLVVIAAGALYAGFVVGLMSWKRIHLESRLANLASSFGVPIGLILLINVGAGLWQLGFPLANNLVLNNPVAEKPGMPRNPTQKRLVWIIFDGWDLELTIENRDSTVAMPNTDKLSRSSFWARRASAPAAGTLLSVPGLTTGKKVTGYIRLGDNLKIQYEGGENFFLWNAEKTIFSDLAEAGIRSAVLSHDLQAHPYCRIFYSLLSKCWENGRWVGGSLNVFDRLTSIFSTANDLVERYWEPRTVNGILGLKEKFERFNTAAFETVCDQNIDFVFIHWMIPHSPFFYNRTDDSYIDGVWGPYSRRYSDNLALTDKTLGALVSNLESCGADANTAYIVTADHGQGEHDSPVFLAKLPGDTSPVVFDGTADLLRLREIISQILQGTARRHQDIKALFEKR